MAVGGELAAGSRVLGGVLGAVRFYLRRRRLKAGTAMRDFQDTADEIHAEVSRRYETLFTHSSKPLRGHIASYLESAEFRAAIRQLIALRLLYGRRYPDVAEQALATLGGGMHLYLRSRRGLTSDLPQAVFSELANVVDDYVKRTRKLWRAMDEPGLRQLLQQQVDLIPRTVESLISKGPAEASISWIDRYCAAAAERYAKIRAPHWDAQVIVPVEKVYVPAHLQLIDRRHPDDSLMEELRAAHEKRLRAAYENLHVPSLGLDPAEAKSRQIAERNKRVAVEMSAYDRYDPGGMIYPDIPIDRAVVLGDPGAGKTTLATRVAADALAGHEFLNSTEIAQPIPFVITLRDYGSRLGPFVKYIEHMAAEEFQCVPPSGLIEFLLLTGRGLVIFDGLDELLDASLRRRVTQSIESFATSYVSAPMLVTSRHVGYDLAPLDGAVFTAIRVKPFDEDNVSRYAHNWYELDESIPRSRRRPIAESFLNTTSTIGDLRSNPLLLALLCNLYKATGYQDLPRSRPAVLEKCALVLFDRWDRYRSIGDVDFERDFEPVVAYLAHELFLCPTFSDGITESKLIELSTSFLWPRVYDNESQARSFARSLVEHCKGRAWIFTDVGTTAEGEPIYQFAHRTFLEYFAALYICRHYRTPDAILTALLPHIKESDWGLVPLLATQIVSRRFDSAADEMLHQVAGIAPKSDTPAAVGVLRFALQILTHVPVGPRAIRDVVGAIAEVATGNLAAEEILTALPDVSKLPADNIPAYRSALAECGLDL